MGRSKRSWHTLVVVLVVALLAAALGTEAGYISPPAIRQAFTRAGALPYEPFWNSVNGGCVDNPGTTSTDCSLARLTVVANVGALPAMNCNPGDLAIVTAAVLGQQIYENSGSGACVWTQQSGGGGGGGGGGVTTYSNTGIVFAAGTFFLPIGGGAAQSATEGTVQTQAASAATVQNFTARVSSAVPALTSLAFTWRDNGASQSVTCTIAAAQTSCSDLTHSFTPAAGDLLDIQVVVTGAVGAEALLMMTGYGTAVSTAGIGFCNDASGSTTAYTCTLTGFSLVNGTTIDFVPQTTNTAASTLNVSGTGAVSIVQNNVTGSALVAQDLIGGAPYRLFYNGSTFSRVNAPETAWTGFTYSNAWTDFGGGLQAGQFMKDREGLVHLRGVIKPGTTTAGTIILTLPAGFRPVTNGTLVYCMTDIGSEATTQPIRMSLGSNGQLVNTYAFLPSYCSMDAITFSVY